MAKFPEICGGRTPDRVVSRDAPLFARLGPSGTRPADCGCGLYHDSTAVAGHGALASRRCGYQKLCRVPQAGTGAVTRRSADRLALVLVLPVPGLAAIFAVAAIKRGVNARLIGSIIVEGLVFVRVWALNQWGARKLNYKIQELHRMEGDDE